MKKFNYDLNQIIPLIVLILILILTFTTRKITAEAKYAQTDWFVPDDFPDIQSAINAISSGDVIWVRPGIYVGSLDYKFKSIAIRSTDGPEVTTIVGDGDSVLYIGGPDAEIIGFTITGGTTYFGAGVLVEGSGSLIKGNIFEGNSQGNGGYGAAIGGREATPLIEGNIFRNNSCDSQGLSGVISMVNNSAPLIINNIIEDNTCRAINMTILPGNPVQVINNTIIRNEGGIRVAGQLDNSAHTYRNNIIVRNDFGFEDNGSGGIFPVWENNLVFDNVTNYLSIPDQTGINGNISEDPQFIGEIFHIYLLRTTSPAVDSGSDFHCPAVDFNEAARPQGMSCDIGAYEVIHTTAAFTKAGYEVIEGSQVVITVSLDIALPVMAFVEFQSSDGSALANFDYIPAAGTLAFPTETISQTFTVTILDDIRKESNETINLSLLNPDSPGAFVEVSSPAILTIIDNDYGFYLPITIKD